MITSILLAADASRHALTARDEAFALAEVYKAKVVIVNVLDVRLLEMPPYLDYAYPFESIPLIEFPVELLEGLRSKAERVIEDMRIAAEDRGIAAEARLEEGIPSEVIAELGQKADLIVIGKRGEHAKWGKDMLGSVTEGVVRRATSPVFITEAEVSELHTFAVLYDGSRPSDQALKLTADLAEHLGASLQVLTVGNRREQVDQIQEQARSYLSAFSFPATYYALEGNVVKAVQEQLKREPADAVAMGRKGYSLLERLILGSTAEHLMRVLPVPVLLVP